MEGNPRHTEAGTGRAGDPLPLQGFYVSLQQNGFAVTPGQIFDANRIIAHYASGVRNELALCDYLCPIFARDEEEQIQFKEIFLSHFKRAATPPPPVTAFLLPPFAKKAEPRPPGSPPPPPVQTARRCFRRYLLGAFLIACLLPLHSDKSNKPFPRPDFKLTVLNASTNRKAGQGPLRARPGEIVKVRLDMNDRGTTRGVTVASWYDWGDGSKTDIFPVGQGYNPPIHLYNRNGRYTLTVHVDVFYYGKFRARYTITVVVNVCDLNASLAIENATGRDSVKVDETEQQTRRYLGLFSRSDSVKVGETVELRALITGKPPTAIQWKTSEGYQGSGSRFAVSFYEEGPQVVSCLAVYDSLNSPCTLEQTIRLFSYREGLEVVIRPVASAQPVDWTRRLKLGWVLLPAALGFIAALVLTKLHAARAAKDTAVSQLFAFLSTRKQPAEIRFPDKSFLTVLEPEIKETAKGMRRRLNDGATYLNVRETIRKTIGKNGFFQPVLSERTQQSEYLVLVDASHNNNQQVKLFDYLLDTLKKSSVFFERYYYRYEPAVCYSGTDRDPITLEALSDKYRNHVLLIFGNAHQLLEPHYPLFKKNYLSVLDLWQSKAILTPVPFPDWDSKELRALSPRIPVVPVDVEGQLLLMDILFNENADLAATLRKYEKSFYQTASVDFEDVDELKQYCHQVVWARNEEDQQANVLFQWIAALAVYPKIRWELTIAIGKAILDKYDKTEQLNFTTLLRVARIRWMKDGQFPDYTRLDLLKELIIGNEVVARETVLALLAEITPNELNEQQLGYEEKEIQRITNEFLLYAHDPVKYAAYKTSKELFAALWEKKKILDSPSRMYLANKEGGWETPIRMEVADPAAARKVPAEQYFKRTAAPPRSRAQLTASSVYWASLGLLVLTSCLFALRINFPAALSNVPVQNIRFTLEHSGLVPNSEVQLNVGGSLVKFKPSPYSKPWALFPVTNPAQQVTVRLNGQQLYKAPLQITREAYVISVTNRNVLTLMSGATVVKNRSVGRTGFFVQNEGGQQFAVCSSPVFPRVTSVIQNEDSVFTGTVDKATYIGTAFRESQRTPLIGLVAINDGIRCRNAVSANVVIRGVREVTKADVGRAVYLHNAGNSVSNGPPVTTGVIETVNTSMSVGSGNSAIKLTNCFITDVRPPPGQAGMVLLDGDNYALGILVAGNPEKTYFVPLQDILDEFNVSPIENQAAYPPDTPRK